MHLNIQNKLLCLLWHRVLKCLTRNHFRFFFQKVEMGLRGSCFNSTKILRGMFLWYFTHVKFFRAKKSKISTPVYIVVRPVCLRNSSLVIFCEHLILSIRRRNRWWKVLIFFICTFDRVQDSLPYSRVINKSTLWSHGSNQFFLQ